jgi:hypothetical protein
MSRRGPTVTDEDVQGGGWACDHNALVGLNAIPDPERKLMDGARAGARACFDDLILEGIVADAGEGAADLFGRTGCRGRARASILATPARRQVLTNVNEADDGRFKG